MVSRQSRMGATCAIAGSVLVFLGTYLHPMEADPNDATAAFAEYAADQLWVASHMTQLIGVALLGVCMYPKWVAGLAIVGGVSTAIAGVVMAYTGFSGLTMAINMPASSVLLVWMLTVGVCMCRQG